MKPHKQKSPEAYIRLLNLFERELKKYHTIFDNDSYQINYVLSRKKYTNDCEIKVVFSIQRTSIFRKLIKESQNLKRLLETYCRYFSVSDILIVRPYTQKRGKLNGDEIITTPIEERLSFEMYKEPETWREIIN
jgi:hypothetical protein